LQHFCNDVTVPAFRSLPQKLLDKLEPWPLAKCVPYSPEALAGKLAYGYDQGLGPCFDVARKKMEHQVTVEAMCRIGGDSQRIHHLRVGYAGLTFKHVLLPVWLMAYRHGKKTYRVTINACNGGVMGERPYSALKIGLTVAAALAVLVILL
jgi:hypothetical protein